MTNGDQTHPWVFSQRLTQPTAVGSAEAETDWTLLSVSLSKPPDDQRASGDLQITLRLDGVGEALFTEYTLVEQGTA